MDMGWNVPWHATSIYRVVHETIPPFETKVFHQTKLFHQARLMKQSNVSPNKAFSPSKAYETKQCFTKQSL